MVGRYNEKVISVIKKLSLGGGDEERLVGDGGKLGVIKIGRGKSSAVACNCHLVFSFFFFFRFDTFFVPPKAFERLMLET